MWVRYEPYADPDFVPAFARDPEARSWEMFIACALLDAGKSLQSRTDRPHKNGGYPDLCILDGEQRIWIEAIAPGCGDPGEDQIPEIVPLNEGGRAQLQPIRQIQLRIASALWTKSKKLRSYLSQGIVAETDVCLIAVGGARFDIYAQGTGFPLALSTVFPIGSEFVRVERGSLEIVGRGFHSSSAI